MRSTLPTTVATGLLLLALPVVTGAQQTTTVVGVLAGYSATEQIWEPEADVERVGGVVIGAYLDAATPSEWLSVLAEGTYTQRGGDVAGGGTGLVEGAVRSDYLSVNVRPKARARVGRARLNVAVGPTVDILVRSRVAPGFETVLAEEGTTVFGVTAGVGLELWVGGGRTFGVEGRIFEGLADAYSGDFVSLRNRSWEIVGRFGISLER